jgi:hypothetical protein
MAHGELDITWVCQYGNSPSHTALPMAPSPFMMTFSVRGPDPGQRRRAEGLPILYRDDPLTSAAGQASTL